jgi:hypothetical protein
MNGPVNRSTGSPTTEPIVGSEVTGSPVEPDIALESDAGDEGERNQPIPPPSHPRQYRAIGLVQGIYQRSDAQLTKGTILTEDGTPIDSVVLGRVISLVKNHLDLEKPHLWVVYPRTRQENDALHVQIVGVWEPETLKKDEDLVVATGIDAGYFSIRGEVIFTDRDAGTVIVKIRQSPKTEGEKPKFFKLKLRGTLPGKPVSRFWDFRVRLTGDALVIREGLDLGFASKKKPGRGGNVKKPGDRNRRPPFDKPCPHGLEEERRPLSPLPHAVLKPERPKPFIET